MFENEYELKKKIECSTSFSSSDTKSNSQYVVYPMRWIILFLFVIYSASNAMHVTQYTIIQDAVVKYYGVSSNTVYWTNMVFMVSYIPLIFPATWLVDKVGLRVATLIGSFGTCLGAWLKVFSVPRDRYWLGFLGQTAAAVCEVFVLSLPPKVATVWFGPDQVSTACSIGVFGFQLGTAISYLLSPMVVHTQNSIDELAAEFQLLFYIVAGFSTILFVVLLILFKAAPATPPSAAADLSSSLDSNFLQSLKNLLTNRNYVLLLFSYGLNIGIYYAITTVLNQIILQYYTSANEDAGRIGLVLVLAGLIGAVVFGYILDKSHKFKETAVAAYVACVASMLIFTFTLNCGYIGVVYMTSSLLGFFMCGFMGVGFELASELTYPEPEVTTSGILNAVLQACGVALTLLYEWLLNTIGDRWANVTLSLILTLGTVLTLAIRSDLRRQAIRSKT